MILTSNIEEKLVTTIKLQLTFDELQVIENALAKTYRFDLDMSNDEILINEVRCHLERISEDMISLKHQKKKEKSNDKLQPKKQAKKVHVSKCSECGGISGHQAYCKKMGDTIG